MRGWRESMRWRIWGFLISAREGREGEYSSTSPIKV
jgi:hypothetical protein